MKRSKKSILIILSLALVFSIGVSVFTACNDNTGNNGGNTTQYSVTIGSYDESKGTITVDKDKVNAGEEATVTVKAKDGWEIMSFYIGANNLTADFYAKNNMTTTKDYTSGTYKFKVNRDSEVKAEFQAKGTNQGNNYTYTLACNFDSVKGNVEVTPNKSLYADGEAVTLNIVLNNDFVLNSIMVNGTERVSEAKQAGNNYTYTFTFNITGNTTVNVDMGYDVTKIANVSATDFDAAIKSNEWVLCDFWAMDCSPCVNYLGPSLQRLVRQKKLGNVRVIKVELEAIGDITSPNGKIKASMATKLGSDGGLPFVVLFHNGQPVAFFNGAYQDQTTQDNSVIEFIQKHVK